MIRMYQCQTTAQAKDYFRDALSKADYYLEDQELNGQFNGNIAKRLGLEGQIVDTDTFNKLCDNINPKDGGSLTPRTLSDRRVGYDISFHCPKSVSIIHGLTQDKNILNSFEESVHETMLEMQADMQVRVRSQGQYDDRSAPELIWANFVHQTARPVDGLPPDPHLHCHCFTFNVNYDRVEDKFKAGQFHNIKRDMPYYQARFHKRLADKLATHNYAVRKTRDGFELVVVPQKAIDHFSKRTNHIGQVAQEREITNPKELDQLGGRTRAKKQKSLTMPQLREKWHGQLIEEGIDSNDQSEVRTTDKKLTAKQAIDYAINHVFARNSVKRDRQILAEGYKYAVDNVVIELDDVDKALSQNDEVFKIPVGNQLLCTTALVHGEERKMVNLARDGIGKFRPLQPDFDKTKFKHLNEEQSKALHHVMKSQDRLTMIRGGAGTGKTTLLKTAIPTIEKSGKQVFLFAPTAEASRDVLHKEGFDKADTVARLLMDKELHKQIDGQIIWVDEAGMLGTKDMAKVLELVDKHKARLILSGDERQHTAVQRGDAMRILKTVAHIPHISINTIYRQKLEPYKQAVQSISQGNIATGFKQLNKQGSIKQVKSDQVADHLVRDYIAARKEKKSALVISPTRHKRREINQAIREKLKENGLISKQEKTVTIYDNLYLTDAQKRDIRFYKKGQIIQTHQNIPGIKRGSTLTISEIENKTVKIKDAQGRHHILPLQRAKDYDVYIKREITLSKGDEIRLTKNGIDDQGKRLNNGTVLTVTKINQFGEIETLKKSKNKETRKILKFNQGNFDYAYCHTSYGAQGKTVDRVIIAQPASTFPASNQKQFYVSVSRGREGVTIYTDDKEDLLKTIQKSGDRQAATELINDDYFKTRTVDIEIPKTKEIEKPEIPTKEYEPDL